MKLPGNILGSIFVLLILSCSNSKVKEKDSCNLNLANGHQILNKLGCRNCHSINDYDPAPMKNIPLFIEVSGTHSNKLTEYIFKTKHNNMYSKTIDIKTTSPILSP